MKKNTSLFFIFFLFYEVFASGISYKQLILEQINSPHRVFQFLAEVETITYAFSQEEEISDTYFQNILWIRDEFLVVEIFLQQENEDSLAYLHFDNKEKKFTKHFSFPPLFSDLEVEAMFTGFYAKTQEQLLSFYRSLGVNYFTLEIVEENQNYYYRLGDSSAYILFNISSYYPERLVRTIYYNKRPIEYTVIFKNWHPTVKKIPQTIDYYLDNQLVKTDNVVYLQWRGLSSLRNQLISKYSE